MEATKSIPVVVPVDSGQDFRSFGQKGRDVVQVPFEQVRDGIMNVCQGLNEIADKVHDAIDGYSCDEFIVGIEVGVSGKVGLVGISGSANGKGGIQLKFCRKRD